MTDEPKGEFSRQIQGRDIFMPCIVADASSGTAAFLVDAEEARRMLPGDEFDLIEILPGRALLSVALIDYKENDLGDYNEVSIAFFVREKDEPVGIPYLGPVMDFVRSRVKTYIHWLPVNQSFTQEAGSEIWGFPKTVEEISIDYTDTEVSGCLVAGGKHVLTLKVARGGTRTIPDATMTTYTHIHGVPHRTAFTTGAEGFGFRLGGASIELGDHPYAEGLRRLGLPSRPLMSTWMEKMHGRFEAPQKL